MARWWSRKYNLPPNHELFLERSLPDLHQEMLEDLMIEESELKKRIEKGEDAEGNLLRELNNIQKMLGEDEGTEDMLWDKWEAQLAAGEIPDLDEMPPGA